MVKIRYRKFDLYIHTYYIHVYKYIHIDGPALDLNEYLMNALP